jgi:hypothetical protein
LNGKFDFCSDTFNSDLGTRNLDSKLVLARSADTGLVAINNDSAELSTFARVQPIVSKFANVAMTGNKIVFKKGGSSSIFVLVF